MRYIIGVVGTVLIFFLFLLLVGFLQVTLGGFNTLGALPALVIMGGSVALLIVSVKKLWLLTAKDNNGTVNKKPVIWLAILTIGIFGLLLMADQKSAPLPQQAPAAVYAPPAPEPQRPMSSVNLSQEEIDQMNKFMTSPKQ